jgi:hypothetical protein
MEVVCIAHFGRWEPGDVVELPDDAEFSPLYFAEKPTEDDSGSDKAEASDKATRRRGRQASRLATSTDEALGKDTDKSDAPVVSPPADDADAGSDELDKNEG